MSVIRTTKEVEVDLRAAIAKFNDVMANEDISEEERKEIITEVSIDLPEYEKEYAAAARVEVYSTLSKTDNPMIEGIKMFIYPVLKHKDIKDETTKMVIEKEIVEADKIIDIAGLDNFCKRKAAAQSNWQGCISKFNQLLCLKAAGELGLDKKQIAKTYYLKKMAADIELGKTPTSNTQALKMLQSVIDAIVFEADESGNNLYRATSHDINYLMMVYTKRGGTLTATVSNDTTMKTLVTEIIYRILSDGNYSVNYKKNK